MTLDAAFAIPGDLHTRTGGYVYERRMLESLPGVGQPVRHIPLLPSWPHPSPRAMADAAARLGALGRGTPLILDGLVFGSIDTDLLASLACPVIAMLHHPLGLEAGLPPDRAAALIVRETANLRHAAHVVVPSAHTRDILVADFGVATGDISVALPGFDRPPDPRPLPPATPPLILSVGLICRRKGHDVLLDALARIAGLDWQAAIVGMTHDDGVRRALLDQRAGLGLDARVRFTGEIPEADLDLLWRQARVFALATRYEGYGMVLSEAQLYGLPIVSCAVGAVPQTVSAAEAVLVPPDDPAAFAGALVRLLSDPAAHARMAAASRDAGRALPDWDDAARVMARALDMVRAKAPPPPRPSGAQRAGTPPTEPPEDAVTAPPPAPPSLADRIGQVIGTSDWVRIDQARIDAFADVTEDWQFLHTDPARATATPFGGTIAHGFLTLALLSRMAETALPWLAGARHSVNYGFDRLRFLAPVRAGSRVRTVFTLAGVEDRPGGVQLLRLGVEVGIEGAEKPALVADWRVMLWHGGAE